MLTTIQPKTHQGMDRFLVMCRRKTYKAKSTILCAGDVSDSLYYIVKGSVAIVIEDDDGREMIVTYLNQGDFFGEMGLFEDDASERTAWVKARNSCEVAEISYERFKLLIREDPEILLSLSAQLAHRLKDTTRKMGDLAFMDVTGRVAGTLLELCRQPDAMTHPDGMQIKITRQEIGRIVGCSREMVGRVLKSLETQGLVTVKGKTMVVYGTR